MATSVSIIYNDPAPDRYEAMGEQKAVLGVLEEVHGVQKALEDSGYSVALVPLSPPVDRAESIIRKIDADVIFNLFEGFAGNAETEAGIAEILARTGQPFTGCPASALSLALDKSRTKETLLRAGILTPRYQILGPRSLSDFHLDFPCIVKPLGEDASHGLAEESVVHDFPSLEKQVLRVSRLFQGNALVEEFISGREFNATALGNNEPVVLPPSEIIYTLPCGSPRILTFAAKWEPDNLYFHNTEAKCPADIDIKLKEEMTEIVTASFRLIGCRGYARVDMRLDRQGRLNVLEINPNPDISPGAGAARQARAAGMSYIQFIEKTVLLAVESKNDR